MVRSEYQEAIEQCVYRLATICGSADPRIILRILYEELGGMRLNIPTIKDLEIEERDRRIRLAFNGVNYHELAVRWGLSVRHVRRIVNKC